MVRSLTGSGPIAGCPWQPGGGKCQGLRGGAVESFAQGPPIWKAASPRRRPRPKSRGPTGWRSGPGTRV